MSQHPCRAALYARVSTTRQEEEATIESQIAAIERFAQQKSYEVPAENYFIDEAVSGAKLDRPALNRLRNLAAEDQFEAVLVLCPDRLARDYPYLCVLMDEFKRCGVPIVFVEQLADPNDPHGQFILGMQGLFAEYERIQTTERLRRGKLYRIQQGQLMSPRAPYGYRYIPVSEADGGRWVVNDVEAAVVEQMFQWYTEDDLSICQLVDRLNEVHEATPPRGKQWHFSTVERLLKQPAYKGKSYYNRTRTCPGTAGQPRKHRRGVRQTEKHEARPRDEWVEIEVPALISESLWDRAQEQLAMNQKFATRNNTQRFYLLRSLLVCDVCGRTLTARGRANSKEGAVTYYCTNRGKHRNPDVPEHKRSAKGEEIEPLVWDVVSNLLRNPRLIEDAWQHEQARTTGDGDEVDRLQAHQRGLERQWTRLLDGFQDELLDKDELALRKAHLDQERDRIDQRLQRLQRQQRQQQAKEQMIQDFETFCHQTLEKLDALGMCQ